MEDVDLSASAATLEVLELNENPDFTVGPVPAWTSEFSFATLDLAETNRNGDLRTIDLVRSASSLQTLRLGNNPFAGGPFPEWVAQLSSLRKLDLSHAQLIGDLVGVQFGAAATTLTQLRLAHNGGFTAGPLPRWHLGMPMLRVLDLADTNRNGDMSIFFRAPTASLLQAVMLSNNTGFNIGPLPARLANFPQLTTVTLSHTNRVGAVDPDACVMLIASSAGTRAGYQCQCKRAYKGARCQTCRGCKEGLVCADHRSHRLALDGGEFTPGYNLSSTALCTVPADVAAAFPPNTTELRFSNSKLAGVVPDMSTKLPKLEVLDLSGNPNLAPNQDWTWTMTMPGLRELNLRNANQLVPYGYPCGGHHEVQSCLVQSECRTHCCNLDVSADPTCPYCDSDGGCFQPLALGPAWWAGAVGGSREANTVGSDGGDGLGGYSDATFFPAASGWDLRRYNAKQLLTLPGPTGWDPARMLRRGTDPITGTVEIVLLWGPALEGGNDTADASRIEQTLSAAVGKSPPSWLDASDTVSPGDHPGIF
jgi:hypothetical protein